MSNHMLAISVPPETVETAKDAILAVLETSAGDKVKLQALRTLAQVSTVRDIRIEGCQFTAYAPETDLSED